MVTVTARKSDTAFVCHANDGTDVTSTQAVLPVHTRLNTPAAGLFAREGCTQTGWNTTPDGTGQTVVQGGRVDLNGRKTLDLYALWQPWTDAEAFTWRLEGEGAVITGCDSTDAVLAVPAELDGPPGHCPGRRGAGRPALPGDRAAPGPCPAGGGRHPQL